MTIIDRGGSIGSVDGIECPAWIRDHTNQRYDYLRLAELDDNGGIELSQLAQGEIVLAPRLIFSKAAALLCRRV